MTVRERILAIKLLEKQERNPEQTQDLGIHVHMVKNKLICKNTNNKKGGETHE